MKHHNTDAIRTLTEQTGKIMKGDYQQAQRISELIDAHREDEEMAGLAEASNRHRRFGVPPATPYRLLFPVNLLQLLNISLVFQPACSKLVDQ